MSRLNIPSTIQDSSYRYTMPKMTLKQESRLNGVKTNVFNIADVAHALRVPESAIIKYFCSEVGANQEQTSIIKGQHTYDALLKLLDKFIHQYVLCKKCGYPEQYMVVEKKDLTAICNACGASRKLDTIHKAGKQLLKDVPNFYANNPEFKGKSSKAPSASAQIGESEAKDGKKKKKKSKKGEEVIEETKEEVVPEKKKKKKKESVETGDDKATEADALNSEVMSLNSEDIKESIEQLRNALQEGQSNDQISELLRNMAIALNVSSDYKYYILMNTLFGVDRSPLKNWDAHEKCFLDLVSRDGRIGIKRLLQVFIRFFVIDCTELSKVGPTFMNKMYDQEVFSGEFLLKWHESTKSLDRHSPLHDRKAEKAFKEQLTEFIDYVKRSEEAEYDEEADYGEEEEATQQIQATEETKETPEQAAARKQKELIAQQQEEQRQKMEELKIEAQKEQQQLAANDIAQIEVNDEFDIDDI